jgi:hypothetical protein
MFDGLHAGNVSALPELRVVPFGFERSGGRIIFLNEMKAVDHHVKSIRRLCRKIS